MASGQTKISGNLASKCARLFVVENKISNLKKQVKENSTEKKTLMDEIMEEMKNLDLKTIETDMGTINRQSIKRKETLNESFIQNALMEMYKNTEQAKDIKAKIMKVRKTQTKERIKISKAE